MVPENFNEFFAASATVSGALIGLLFVAISVSPEKLSSQGENVEHQIKAAAAFSALINTLLVSLFALIPGHGFGEATFVLSVVGLASTAGLIIFFLRNRRRDDPIRAGQILLVAGSLVLYTFQLINGAELWRSPHHASYVTTQAEILIVFFIIAIARAWDLVGARDTGFLAGVVGMARGGRDEVGGQGTNDEA